MIQVGDRVRRVKNLRPSFKPYSSGEQSWVVEEIINGSILLVVRSPDGTRHNIENLEKVETMIDLTKRWAFRYDPSTPVKVIIVQAKGGAVSMSAEGGCIRALHPDGRHYGGDSQYDLVPYQPVKKYYLVIHNYSGRCVESCDTHEKAIRSAQNPGYSVHEITVQL